MAVPVRVERRSAESFNVIVQVEQAGNYALDIAVRGRRLPECPLACKAFDAARIQLTQVREPQPRYTSKRFNVKCNFKIALMVTTGVRVTNLMHFKIHKRTCTVYLKLGPFKNVPDHDFIAMKMIFIVNEAVILVFVSDYLNAHVLSVLNNHSFWY